MAQTLISAVTSVMNGVLCGIPFVEGALSIIDYVDEYLIIAGNSYDGTDLYLSILQARFPDKVRILRDTSWDFGTQSSRPVIKSFDEGIRRAKGDWVILQEADMVFHPEFLKKLVERINAGESDAIKFDRWHILCNFQIKNYTEDLVRAVRKASYTGMSEQVILHTGIEETLDCGDYPTLDVSWNFFYNCFIKSCVLKGQYIDPWNQRRFIGLYNAFHNEVLAKDFHKVIAEPGVFPPPEIGFSRAREDNTTIPLKANGEIDPLWTAKTTKLDKYIPKILKPMIGELKYYVRDGLLGVFPDDLDSAILNNRTNFERI